MRHHWLPVILLIGVPIRAPAQGFFEVLQRADSAEHAGAHAVATKLYERAYGLSGFDPAGLDLAARSAALAGLLDDAFRDLDRAIDQGYVEPRLMADSAFAPLHNDPRWAPLEAKLRRKLAAIDEPVRAELIHLADQDQNNRRDFTGLIKKLAAKTPESDAAFKAFTSADSAIQARVLELIGLIGWPTRSKVGDDGAHAAWLVVQHMPTAKQEALLPRLQAAVKAGEAQPGDGAMLLDRVLVHTGKPQVYGSQLSISPSGGALTLDPIEDPACVDVRRRRVGLEPLAEYLKRFGIAYEMPGPCKRAP